MNSPSKALSPTLILLILTLTSCVTTDIGESRRVFKIGAIVPASNAESNIRNLELARDYVNKHSDLLPNATLEIVVRIKDNPYDRFDALQFVCQLLDENVIAIIGPLRSSTVKAIHPLLTGLHIPHIAPAATDPSFTLNYQDFPFLLKMAPPDNIQSEAQFDLVRSFGWSHMALMMSSSDFGRNGLQRFIELALANNWVLTRIEYFHVGTNEAIVRQEIRVKLERIRASGVRVVLLHCGMEDAWLVLTVARSLSMFETGWAWIVSSAVTLSGDIWKTNNSVICLQNDICLTEYAGLLGTSSFHGTGELARDFMRFAGLIDISLIGKALVDSVLTVAYGLDSYLASGRVISAPQFPKGVCTAGRVTHWQHGQSLFEHMRKIDKEGVLGRIHFTSENYPVDSSYGYVNMRRDGWNQIGVWNNGTTDIDHNMVIFPGETTSVPTDQDLQITDVTFRVVTIIETPFVSKKSGVDVLNDTNPQLEGFCIDVLNMLQDTLKFKYQIHLVGDGKYGNIEPDGSWNGIIAEVINGEADLGVSAMFITADRQKVLDWTTPYLDLGLDVLLAKEQVESGLFDFLGPFDITTWLVLMATTCLSGLAVSLCSLVSPWGMRGRYTQRRDRTSNKFEADASTLNFGNGAWFAVSSLLKQGPERAPTSMSGRLVAAFWWASVTIILATYTANLTALLTVERLSTAIASLQDLASQTVIQYGTVEFTAIQDYFKSATLPPFPKMYQFMEDMDTWVPSGDAGIEKVRNSASPNSNQPKYAFVYDSTVLEYAARNPPCVTRVLGKLFRKQGYGIVMPKDSPYTTTLSTAILDMRERGDMDLLSQKWITGSCNEDEAAKAESDQITIERTAGTFALCFAGALAAVLLTLLEFCIASYSDVLTETAATGKTKGWWHHMKRRLHATCRDLLCCCRGSHKSKSEASNGRRDETSARHMDNNQDNSIGNDPNWSLEPGRHMDNNQDNSIRNDPNWSLEPGRHMDNNQDNSIRNDPNWSLEPGRL